MATEFKRSAVAVLQREAHSDEIVLVSRRGKYNDLGLPGGKVENGESSLETIVREVREETGLEFHPDDFLLCIEGKPCGEYLVDVYCLSYFKTADVGSSRINTEDCFLGMGSISKTVSENCSFKEFNQDVWDYLVKSSILPWRTGEDADLEKMIEYLMGSCINTIDSAMDLYSNGELDADTLSLDQLGYIDNFVQTCPACGWNVDAGLMRESESYGEDVCDDCADEMEDDG